MVRIIQYVIVAIAAMFALLYLSGYGYLVEGARVTYLQGNTTVGIFDYRNQPTRRISAAKPAPWPKHTAYNQVALSAYIKAKHQALQTIAFLIHKDGQLLAEHYFNGGSAQTPSGLWSISKTYTSLLLLFAIEDGLIGSIEDPVSQYLAGWSVDQTNTLRLRHLASMSAGLYWEEFDQRPMALIARLNFSDDLISFGQQHMYAIGEPGRVQHYNSGATQMLGAILQSVIKPRSISDYLSEKLWQPLGAENDAQFILDREDGFEKTFGGLVATASDVARLGHVINNQGLWNNKRVLPLDTLALLKSVPFNNSTYTFGYWRGEYNGEPFYFQAGHGGQLCISMPSKGLVITRLGHKATPKRNVEEVAPDAKDYIQEALRIIAASADIKKGH